jgi:DNA/RNA-binding protein KIN17
MRDENGFKQHTLSEGHVRQMQLIGEDPKKYIRQYSADFKRDFIQLLRTAHGEKPIPVNRFYQEYIANKEHIHMNATQWSSLTEFAKYLGREGIVRVSEDDKGAICVAWIDNSPEALRRQDAVRKKERQDRGDEEREKRAIEEQVGRAHKDVKEVEEVDESKRVLERKEGEKISLNFGGKPKEESGKLATNVDTQKLILDGQTEEAPTNTSDPTTAPQSKVKMSFGSAPSKPKNVFAAAKKNALATRKVSVIEPPKKISEAERIMKEEMERKRRLEGQGGKGVKKIRIGFP